MDLEQRQRIVDVICREWNYGDPPPPYIESKALRELLASEGVEASEDDLLAFLDELKYKNLITLTMYLGYRRITGIDQMMCEEPLNY